MNKLCTVNTVSLVFLTETWLSNDVVNSEVFLGNSFTVISRSDRSFGSHGGVLIGASNDVNLNIMDVSIVDYEFSVACVVVDVKLICFVLIYFPPSTSEYRIDCKVLTSCLHSYNTKFATMSYQCGFGEDYILYILGDFNFPEIDWINLTSSNTNEQEFIETSDLLAVSQLIDTPTHKLGNILDLILTNDDTSFFNVHQQLFSDHFPILFYTSCCLPKPVCTESFSKSSFDQFLFNSNLETLFNFITLDNLSNPCYPYEWYELLTQSIGSSLQLKRSKRLHFPTFYSSHTIHILNLVRTNQTKLNKGWSLHNSIKHIELTRALSESIELDKHIYIEQFSLKSPTDCFKLLRSLGFSQSYPSVMYFEDQVLHTESEKATCFNNYFGSVFGPKTINPPTLFMSSDHKICLDDVSIRAETVTFMLSQCNDSSSLGPDLIPSFILYRCSQILTPIVTELFNWVLHNRTWPAMWKLSFVSPLHKDGPRTQIENYRPISILPKLSRILERILFNFIYPKVRNSITKNQHGFMTKRSTVTQMILYLDKVYRNIDSNVPSLAAYFDVRKAFDSVPHHLLLQKLVKFGFCPDFIRLFSSYLDERSQCVKLNNTFSSKITVSSGVPQGSVLGPLLFILFVNDMPNLIVYGTPFLFADDMKVLFDVDPRQIQSDIDNLYLWSIANGLIFHPSKCKILPFGSSSFDESFILGDNDLPVVDNIKDLGFLITHNLSWNSHIDHKLATARKIFGFLRRNVPFNCSFVRKKLLYQSLILSVLLYGSPVWSPSSTYIARLEKFQYKVLKWMFSSEDYVSGLLQLQFLPICYQLIKADVILLWKIYNSDVDCEYCPSNVASCTRASSANQFIIPDTKKLGSNANFFVRATRSVNFLLSQNVISLTMSLSSLKLSLDCYFSMLTKNFNIDNSCCFYLKCMCTCCRS